MLLPGLSRSRPGGFGKSLCRDPGPAAFRKRALPGIGVIPRTCIFADHTVKSGTAQPLGRSRESRSGTSQADKKGRFVQNNYYNLITIFQGVLLDNFSGYNICTRSATHVSISCPAFDMTIKMSKNAVKTWRILYLQNVFAKI